MKAIPLDVSRDRVQSRLRRALRHGSVASALLAASLAIPGPAAAQRPAGGDSAYVGLKTENGAWLKLIVKQDASVYDKPDRSGTPRPIRQFDFLYALPAAPGGKEKLQN